jgi:signal transduction histidine kinase/ActR/RegA family two-component response regulator
LQMAGDYQKSTEEIIGLNRQLSMLNALSRIINQSVDFDQILNNSLDRIIELTGVGAAGIYLLDEGDRELAFAAHRGFSNGFVRGIRRLKLGEGVTGEAALSGESVFIEDYFLHPSGLSLAVEEGLRSLMVIPLKSGTRTFGTLNVCWKQIHRFMTSEEDLFNSIGQIIGGAMERASYYAENAKRLEEQKTLYSISQEIASRLELKEVLQKIMESAVDLLGAEAGTIALWDRRKQSYVTAVVHHLPETMIGKEFSPGSEGLAGEIIGRKCPVLYDDYESHPKRVRDLDTYHFKEAVGLPLIVREMVIGTMAVTTTDPKKHFRQNEVDLLFTFAHQAAIAIGNTILYEDSLAKIKQLTTLQEIGKTLSSTLDMDELLKQSLGLLNEQFDYASCCILILDQDKDELYIRQVIGRDLEKLRHRRFRVGVDGIVGWVARTAEPYYAPDVSKDPHYIRESDDIKSEAAFPLRARDEVIGVLNVERFEPRGFGEEDLRLLSSFASQVSISIQNARLFSDLKQTLQNLKTAQDQIVQAEKLRALGEMASGVAHDFNNLLAVILGNIQLLSHQLDELTHDEVRQRLQTVERSSMDGAETVRRIQEFTGVRRDKEFVSLSINDIVREVVTLTQPRWKDQPQKKGIQIRLETDLPEVLPVSGNPSELREVLTNMVFNAVDAMPQGGDLTLSTSVRPDWVEIRISDTGLGMTEEVKRRIFDPFFTTKGVTNSGLGLSVSYGIMRRHGGEIQFESEAGKGTTFILRLPINYEAPKPKEQEVVVGRKVRPVRILVIDDEGSVREILSKMLGVRGHEVAVASNGEEGIERFKAEPFDVVFTDLGMPKMSGWEVGKVIKELRSRTPVILITGWGMELSRDKMRENGIDLVVTKPFNFEHLNQIVQQVTEPGASPSKA